MTESFLLGLIVSVCMVIILLCSPLFLRLSNQPPAVLHLAVDYMYALLWTIPGLVLLIIYEQFLAGINRAKMVLRISLLVVPIEIPIIYVLVFGKFGFPKLGVAGIGYGFTITYTGTALFLTYYFLRSQYFRQFGLFRRPPNFNFTYLKELLRIGLPMGVMHAIEVSTFAIATFWIARFGTTLLAAHQIVMQYVGLFVTVVFAMSQAITVRVGHMAGSLNLQGITTAVYVGMLLNFALMLLVLISFYLMPELFLRLDLNLYEAKNIPLIKDSISLLWLGGVLLLFDNFRINGFGALRALKDTKFSMYTSLIAFWFIGLPLCYLFAFHWHLGGRGVWWGLIIGIAAGAIMVLSRLHYLLARINLKKLSNVVQL